MAETGKRLNRLEELRGLLKSREHVTARELADELGIGLRTLSRDIEVLRNAGAPIESDRGRGGGLRLQRNWALGRLHLSPEEAIDLLLSIAIAEQLNLPLLLTQLAPVRRKIVAAFGENFQPRIRSLRRRIFVGKPASAAVISGYQSPDVTRLSMVSDAFFNQRRARIVYGTLTTREIEPHFLFLSLPVWYLLAFDKLRQDVRHFRIDRITHCDMLDSRFRLAAPEPYLASAEEGLEGI
jgi:predicted DNA-binding transcriptional regulator YafY